MQHMELDTSNSDGVPSPELALDSVVDPFRNAGDAHGGDAAAGAADEQGYPRQRLRPLDLQEFFALDIKPRGMVLDPIIPEKGLAMLYGTRGTGKTFIALGIGYAVATGGQFLNWQAPQPRRVLLIDGEMPAAALRDRLRSIAAGADATEAPAMLGIIAGDLLETGIGNLASPALQAELDPWLDGVDLLDTSICLRRPADYVPTEGARFEVHIEKARGIHGGHAKPFEASLDTSDGKAVWSMKAIEDVEGARVMALLADGLSIRDIAEETCISKSRVHRLKQKLEQVAEETRQSPNPAG